MARRIAYGLLAVVLAVLALGIMLPGKWHVERSVTVDAAPETVFGLVGDLKRWPAWTEWNTTNDPGVQWRYAGPPTGVGSVMEWQGPRMGTGRVRLTAADPKQGVRFDIAFQGHEPATGGIRFSPSGRQTVVTWSMDGDVGGNPLMHFLAPQVRNMLGEELEERLAKLAEVAKARQTELDHPAPAPAASPAPAAQPAPSVPANPSASP